MREELPETPGTFSILGFDPTTGEIGAAVQSRVFSVGNGVLWAEAGVGAIFMQKVRHRFNRESQLVPLGLELGQHGKSTVHVVCAKSALGVARIRAVAELLKAELLYAEKLSQEAYG